MQKRKEKYFIVIVPLFVLVFQVGICKGADRVFSSDNIITPHSDTLLYEYAQTGAMIDSTSEIGIDALQDSSVSESGRYPSTRATYPPWSLETNALSWMTLRPNVGIEYVFAPRWSASLNFDVAWWRQRSKDRFYQIWTLSPEIRYWFGGYSPSRSFYVGVHAISGSYDLKNGDVGYWNESLVEAGLSLGYVMRLSPNWSLRFGLGGGYLNTSYKKYIRYNDIGEHYVYDGTDRTTYWGITKAEVSFRWNFGRRK